MSIKTFPFDAFRYEETGDLFPLEIEDDGWIVYHGTSAQFSEAIERLGLEWKPVISREEVQRLVAVFEGIDWWGRGRGGLDVLATFTRADFAGTDRKPVFFAQFPGRSVLYAERDWAGGETARGCRQAFADLEHWVTHPEEHAELRYGCDIPAFVDWMKPSRPPRSVEWVRERLSELESLRDRCVQFAANHRAGVVYAVRVKPDFVPYIKNEAGGGFACAVPLPTSMIVGKVSLPADIQCRRQRRGDSAASVRRMIEWSTDPSSLATAINGAKAR